jgi:hypothetical protein
LSCSKTSLGRVVGKAKCHEIAGAFALEMRERSTGMQAGDQAVRRSRAKFSSGRNGVHSTVGQVSDLPVGASSGGASQFCKKIRAGASSS